MLAFQSPKQCCVFIDYAAFLHVYCTLITVSHKIS